MAGLTSPRLEFCKLELCPAKRKCLRNPAAGIVSHNALEEAFGRFAILPGELKCPHFVSLKHEDRYFGSQTTSLAQDDLLVIDLPWLDDLETLLRDPGSPFPPAVGSPVALKTWAQVRGVADKAFMLIEIAKDWRRMKKEENKS